MSKHLNNNHANILLYRSSLTKYLKSGFNLFQAEISEVRDRLTSEIQALRSSLEAADSLADTMSPRAPSAQSLQDVKTQHAEEMHEREQQLDQLQEQLRQLAAENEQVREYITKIILIFLLNIWKLLEFIFKTRCRVFEFLK